MEFAALLREDRLIKELRPPCNRRGAGGGGAYLKLTLAEDAPRLYAVRAQLPDGAAYFGPVRSQRLARGAVTALRLLYERGGADTGRAADAVRRLLSGEPASLADLGRRLAVAVHEGRLEVEPGAPHCPAAALLGTLGGLARARRARAAPRSCSSRARRRAASRRSSSPPGWSAAGAADDRVVAGARPARAGDRAARVATAARPPAVAVLDELAIVEGRLRGAGRRGGDARAPGRLDHRIGARRRSVARWSRWPGMQGSPCEPPPPSP